MRGLNVSALVVSLALIWPVDLRGWEPPHPSVSVVAEAVCTPAGPVINFTVTGTNYRHPNVDVFFNGVKVFDGAFAGPASQQVQAFSGSAPAPPGDVTVQALAVGPWENGAEGGQSGATAVTAPGNCNAGGRFTGGGRQIVVDVDKVTRGLTLHCDLRLSNNLEINWGGNQFHMTQHTAAQCFDDENIDQRPPSAPLDTMIGVGIGRYNGADGYTVRFILVDAGEPGTQDKMAIQIFETANPANVVLNVPLSLLDDGNLQAHYDQPHKK